MLVAAFSSILRFITVYALSIENPIVQGEQDVRECLEANWTYVRPEAFDQTTQPAWTNQVCVYTWFATNAHELRFSSPSSCLDDKWKKNLARVNINQDASITIIFVRDGLNQTIIKSGFVNEDCSFVDMDDGGLYIRSSVHPTYMSAHEWIEAMGAWLIRAAQITFEDGTRHLTPAYPTSYNAQWLRDSFYGISLLWDLANSTHRKDFLASAEWMFGLARADGIMPDFCRPAGTCAYGQRCNYTKGADGWRECQVLDSAGFSVKLAYHIWSHQSVDAQHIFYLRWAHALELSMNATASDPDGSGLLWSNTSRPMVGYGFQDAEWKSGDVLYESVLHWNASLLLKDMALAENDSQLAERMEALAAKIKKSADERLWDDKMGVFRASTMLEHDRVDLWGNAMAGAIGFASTHQAQAIYKYFVQHQADIFWEGQVRQIPYPQQWKAVNWIGDKTYFPFESPMSEAAASVPFYQNGCYWATPLHHVLPFLAKYNREMACRLLNQTIASFRTHGIWEYVCPVYPGSTTGNAGYVASAAATYFASKQLRCWVEDESEKEIIDSRFEGLLHALRLERYIEPLVREGFDSISALKLVNDADLAACGMKLGHRRLLLDRLRTFHDSFV